MTPLTYPRLKTIVDRIKADPSCWDQEHWHCETSHCIAGHAQLDALPADRREEFLRLYESGLIDDDDENTEAFAGVSECTFVAGGEWLELTLDEAESLFSFDTTLEEIEAFLEKARLFAAESAEREAK